MNKQNVMCVYIYIYMGGGVKERERYKKIFFNLKKKGHSAICYNRLFLLSELSVKKGQIPYDFTYMRYKE